MGIGLFGKTGATRMRTYVAAGIVIMMAQSSLAGAEPLVIAHRGAARDAPENTLAAFREAFAQGADGIETDIRLTKDGHAVALHDATMKRTTGGKSKLAVGSATLAQLRKLDVGAWKHERFAGQRIPTLAEVLAAVPAGKRVFIEIKGGGQIVPHVKRAVAASGLRPGQVAVICFGADVLAAAKKAMPKIAAYWLTAYGKDRKTGEVRPTVAEVLATLRRIGADGLDTSADESVVTADFVRAIRRAGFELHCWTVDDPAKARRLRAMGFDSITTNRPGLLLKALGRGAKPTSRPG